MATEKASPSRSALCLRSGRTIGNPITLNLPKGQPGQERLGEDRPCNGSRLRRFALPSRPLPASVRRSAAGAFIVPPDRSWEWDYSTLPAVWMHDPNCPT